MRSSWATAVESRPVSISPKTSRGLFVSAGHQGLFGFFELGPGRFVTPDGALAGLVAFTQGSGFGFSQFGELGRQWT
jgi:hypothetical protein